MLYIGNNMPLRDVESGLHNARNVMSQRPMSPCTLLRLVIPMIALTSTTKMENLCLVSPYTSVKVSRWSFENSSGVDVETIDRYMGVYMQGKVGR